MVAGAVVGLEGIVPDDVSHLYRRTDPETSAEAAELIEFSGRRKARKWLLLTYVYNNPGRTAGEIADGTSVPRDEVGKRLSDLMNDKLIFQGMARKCKSRNTRMVTWWPSETLNRQVFGNS